jgi:hypothetical protein
VVVLRPLLFAVAACARFELDEPIGIVATSDLTDGDTAAVATAAECWNLAYGIPFVVDRDTTADQRVTVEYGEFVCGSGALGRFTPGLLATIHICPQFIDPRYDFFAVLLHELGHAAGIRGEGFGDDSVTGQNAHVQYAPQYVYSAGRFGPPAFSAEDTALLAGEVEIPGATCDGEVLLVARDGLTRCVCQPTTCPADAYEPDGPNLVLRDGAILERTLCVERRGPDIDLDPYVAEVPGEVTVVVHGDQPANAITVDGRELSPTFSVAADMPFTLTPRQVNVFPVAYTISFRAN